MDLRWIDSHQVPVEVVGRVVVHAEDMERLAVDLDVAAGSHVGGCQEVHVVVHVLILVSVEELAWNDTRVLLRGLVDGDRVVCEVERDDESAV